MTSQSLVFPQIRQGEVMIGGIRKKLFCPPICVKMATKNYDNSFDNKNKRMKINSETVYFRDSSARIRQL